MSSSSSSRSSSPDRTLAATPSTTTISKTKAKRDKQAARLRQKEEEFDEAQRNYEKQTQEKQKELAEQKTEVESLLAQLRAQLAATPPRPVARADSEFQSTIIPTAAGKPSDFFGLPTENANRTIASVTRYMSLRRVPDNDLVKTFISFLRGDAEEWIASSPAIEELNYDSFKAEFIARFSPISAGVESQTQLLVLSERRVPLKDVKQYSQKFMTAASIAGKIIDDMTVRLYIKGLPEKIAKKILERICVAETAAQYKIGEILSLDKIIKFVHSQLFIAEATDTEIQSRQYTHSSTTRPAQIVTRPAASHSSSTITPSANLAYMEELFTLKGWSEEYKTLFTEKRCFLCREKGHQKRNCPGLNKPAVDAAKKATTQQSKK